MKIRVSDFLSFSDQITDELPWIPEERPRDVDWRVAVALEGGADCAYGYLVQKRVSEDMDSKETLRIFAKSGSDLEGLLLPYYAFECLCRHLRTLNREIDREIDISGERGYLAKLSVGEGTGRLSIETADARCLDLERQDYVKRIAHIKDKAVDHFVLRGAEASLAQQVLGSYAPALEAVWSAGNSCFWLGSPGLYVCLHSGATTGPSECASFGFPRYSGWLNYGAIRFTFGSQEVQMESLAPAILAVRQVSRTGNPSETLRLSDLPIGVWTVRHPEKLQTSMQGWSEVQILLSPKQVLLQPANAVGLDVTTFGSYAGLQMTITAQAKSLTSLLKAGFFSYEIRHGRDKHLYLKSTLRLPTKEPRLLDGERRRKANDATAILLYRQGDENGATMRLFPLVSQSRVM